jgi:hypothetical protein
MVAFDYVDYVKGTSRPTIGGPAVAAPSADQVPGSARSAPARPGRQGVRACFWRRLLLLALAAGAGALTSSVASRLIASASPSHAGLSCPASASAPWGGNCPTTTYVARPGDTIWAVAVRFSGTKDPRPLEYLLESQIGGGTLQPGEILHVP